MKLAFLLLVLANLLLFAWQQDVFGRFAEPGREPERVARQIEAERFRVLSEQEVQQLRQRAAEPRPQTQRGDPAAADMAVVDSRPAAPTK